MIELARHIEVLLLDNDCVIVPGLGGFVTHHIPARRVDGECKFLPPYRTLGFSPKMVINDGLLVQSYMQAYDTNYPSALRILEQKINELKSALSREGRFILHGIGTLQQNIQDDYTFTPLEAGLLSPSLYGLSSFEMKTLAELEAEHAKPAPTLVVEQPVAEPEEEKRAIVIRMERRWITGIAAACIGILLMLTFVLPSPNGKTSLAGFKPIMEWFNTANQQETIAKVDAKPTAKPAVRKAEVKKEVAIAAAHPEEAKAEAKTATPATPVATPKAEPYYTIVLASSITLKNAEAFAKQLSDKGYAESSVLTKDNLNRVVYARFASESEARNKLRELSRECDNFTQAWVLRVK
ncbi:MAG: SPOR domain-containing protein [Bacteroidaceae bacterium]|nr:SPOR domain-containing protein [Bacteroidaceae bacterium]